MAKSRVISSNDTTLYQMYEISDGSQWYITKYKYMQMSRGFSESILLLRCFSYKIIIITALKKQILLKLFFFSSVFQVKFILEKHNLSLKLIVVPLSSLHKLLLICNFFCNESLVLCS